MTVSQSADWGAADQILRALVKELNKADSRAVLKLRQGVCTATSIDGSVSVAFSDGTAAIAGIKCLTAPQVNDSVWVLANGPDRLVIGAQQTGAPGPLYYIDAGYATSSAVDAATTPLKTFTDPFGIGVGYRVDVTYSLGLASGAWPNTAWARIYTNGAGSRWAAINNYSSARVTDTVTMLAGGTVTFQGYLVNKSGITWATIADTFGHTIDYTVTKI